MATDATMGSLGSTVTSTLELHWLERQWASMFVGRDPTVVVAVVGFIMHELVYFGRWIPFLIADHIPALQKYKLQPDKHLTDAEYRKLFILLMRNHFLVQLPLMLLFHPTAAFFGMDIEKVPFPSWQKILQHVLISMFIEDLFHYVFHRLLHWGPLYRGIHKVHHEYSAPVGIAAEYAHPIETVILGMGTFAGPMSIVLTTADFHIITMLVWVSVRLCQTVDAHSGYDFPWSLRTFIPFWAGADHHDYHHQMFVGNYATSFRWWDRIFGTDKAYRRYRAKQRAQKTAAQNGAAKRKEL